MKTLAIIQIDNFIDLITNSSSELFVIRADQAKEYLLELLNESLKGYTSFVPDGIEERMFEGNHYVSSEEYMLEETLAKFPVEARDEIKQKYLSKPRFYGVVFDRDWDAQQDYVPQRILESLGFELISSDH